MKENIILSKSYDFAVSTVDTYKILKRKKEFVLSKQLLRSGTSVGANIRESANAQSKADFIHKLYISQKECDEAMYWLELLHRTEYLSKEEFESIHKEANEILKILKSIIISTKRNHNLKR